MEDIKAAYKAGKWKLRMSVMNVEYDKDMIKAIKGDVSGKYEAILVKLCEVMKLFGTSLIIKG